MKVGTEYSAININHDDLEGYQQQEPQQQQHSGISRTWMLMLTVGQLLTMGMALLSLKVPGQTKSLDANFFASDSMRSNPMSHEMDDEMQYEGEPQEEEMGTEPFPEIHHQDHNTEILPTAGMGMLTTMPSTNRYAAFQDSDSDGTVEF